MILDDYIDYEKLSRELQRIIDKYPTRPNHIVALPPFTVVRVDGKIIPSVYGCDLSRGVIRHYKTDEHGMLVFKDTGDGPDVECMETKGKITLEFPEP